MRDETLRRLEGLLARGGLEVADHGVDECPGLFAPFAARVEDEGPKAASSVIAVLFPLATCELLERPGTGVIEDAVTDANVDHYASELWMIEHDVEDGLALGSVPLRDDLFLERGEAEGYKPGNDGIADGVMASHDTAAECAGAGVMAAVARVELAAQATIGPAMAASLRGGDWVVAA